MGGVPPSALRRFMPRGPNLFGGVAVKTWLITDTHFNHQMLIDEGLRPADFQQRIISNVRRLVNDQDLVIHLGDVILGQNSDLEKIMARMRGTWVLVKGNHDKQTNTWFRKRGFAAVMDAMSLNGVLLTHIPVDELPCGHTLNIHGHCHGDDHRITPGYLKPFNKLLALEWTDYHPVEFDKFRQS